MRTAKAKIILLLVFSFVLIGLCSYYEWDSTKDYASVMEYVTGDELIIEEESGFYEKDLTVHMAAASKFGTEARIYYTINGMRPGENSLEYKDGIKLKAVKGKSTLYSLRAVMYYKGVSSEIYERTYVVGENPEDYHFLPIVNIATDYKNLYDEETGIFINFNERGDEWLRPSHVTILDTDGSVLTDQDTGLIVQGGTSAQFAIKSLKIVAGEEWDEDHDSFIVNFFREEKEESRWSLINDYNQLKLRSGSQDQNRSNIRSSVVSRLSEQAGFDGCTGTYRCVIYINGEFYGIFDMQEQYSASFLGKHFNLPDNSQIYRIKAKESMVLEHTHTTELFQKNLNLPANRAALEEKVDMDNFLMYYAVQVLTNNVDWPDNNYAAWRYTGEYDPSNPYTDGRVRFLLFDTDLTYFYDPNPNVFPWGNGRDILQLMLAKEERGSESIFSNVMASTYYRERFVTLLCDLMNTCFTENNVLKIAQEEFNKITYENNLLQTASYRQGLEYHYGLMTYAISNRKAMLMDTLATYMGYTDQYSVNVIAGVGSMVTWNQTEVMSGHVYTGQYFSDVSFELKAVPYNGYKFSHWLLNGQVVEGDTIRISGDDASADGCCNLKAVCVPSDEEVLQISEASAKGALDWIKITNAGHIPVKLNDYYISDRADQLLMFQLPELTLEAGESILIDGAKNNYRLGNYQCNFNINDEETVFLTRFGEEEPCDQLAIPRMVSDETYGHVDTSPVLRFFKNDDNKRYVSD